MANVDSRETGVARVYARAMLDLAAAQGQADGKRTDTGLALRTAFDRRDRQRRLHVERGAVDVAVEIELDRDRRCSQIACRRHLCDAGNLRELPLERLRHRGGHGFGAAAGQACGDLDGWEVDLRQRRHRQQRIGDEADKENAGHQQRGADGIANEGCGDALAHSCLTLDCAGSELATAVVTRVPG